MLEVPNLASLEKYVGEHIGTTEWKEISQQMIDDFATATQDFQWIHEDTERTRRESPFGVPIAHGFLILSLVSRMIEEVLQIASAKMGVNYGLNKVRFTSHVPAGSRIRMKVELLSIEPSKIGKRLTFACVVEKESGDKPACVAEFIGLIIES